jgi:4-hydroxymandelate oxidase
MNRRTALRRLASWAAASRLLRAQEKQGPRLTGEAAGRITPLAEVLNPWEFEAMAERKLAPQYFAAIAGGDRSAFERIVFRPRRFINAVPLDLSVTLFGEKLYTPIVVGPAQNVQRFDPEGEVALARGASAVNTVVVISERSGQPIEKIAAESKSGIWYQIFPQPDMAPVLSNVERAVRAGAKVVVITIGTPYRPVGADGAPTPAKLNREANPQMSWAIVDQVRRAANVPIVLKGIMSPDEALAADDHGVAGVVVSNYGGQYLPGLASPMEMLSAVVDRVSAKMPVLIDGSFRRGSDVVKALALGAKAVLVVRPVLWALAAYGSAGVRTMLEMIQAEAASTMAACGKPTLALVDRTMVRLSKH